MGGPIQWLNARTAVVAVLVSAVVSAVAASTGHVELGLIPSGERSADNEQIRFNQTN